MPLLASDARRRSVCRSCGEVLAEKVATSAQLGPGSNRFVPERHVEHGRSLSTALDRAAVASGWRGSPRSVHPWDARSVSVGCPPGPLVGYAPCWVIRSLHRPAGHKRHGPGTPAALSARGSRDEELGSQRPGRRRYRPWRRSQLGRCSARVCGQDCPGRWTQVTARPPDRQRRYLGRAAIQTLTKAPPRPIPPGGPLGQPAHPAPARRGRGSGHDRGSPAPRWR